MSSPAYAENTMPAVKMAGGFQTKLPIKLSTGALTTWLLSGTGAPGTAGTPSALAPQGSLYTRTDGSSTSTRLYVATGTGTWTSVTTAT